MVTPFPRVLARCLVCVCVALSLITPALSFYSISYAATSKYHQVQGQVGQTFIEAPSAEHVADMYARLSGLPPLLREGKGKTHHVSKNFAFKIAVNSSSTILGGFRGTCLGQ